MNSIKDRNKPAYNVLQTVKWHFKAKNQIEFTFNSQAMIVEFDKLRGKFLKKLRTTLNNFSITIDTVVSKTDVKTNYVKTRKDIYNDLVKANPDIEYLKEKFGLDIENEPKLK